MAQPVHQVGGIGCWGGTGLGVAARATTALGVSGVTSQRVLAYYSSEGLGLILFRVGVA